MFKLLSLTVGCSTQRLAGLKRAARVALWLSVVNLIVAPAIAGSPSEVTSYQFMGVTSTDTYPVAINTKGHVLKIPRNYLETATLNSDGTNTFFRVVMTLPEFHGNDVRTAFLLGTLSSHAGWWDSAPSTLVWAYEDDAISSAKEQQIKPVLEAAKTQETANIEFGLMQVVSRKFIGDYYISKTTTVGDVVVIECYNIIRDLCSSEFDLKPGLVIKYEYARSNLPEWQHIDTEVKRVMRSFLEK